METKISFTEKSRIIVINNVYFVCKGFVCTRVNKELIEQFY